MNSGECRPTIDVLDIGSMTIDRILAPQHDDAVSPSNLPGQKAGNSLIDAVSKYQSNVLYVKNPITSEIVTAGEFIVTAKLEAKQKELIALMMKSYDKTHNK